MVSNLVVRNKRTGYVTFVAKARVGGESRTVEYICGLGNMDQEEFKHFQKWAHSIKDQQMRRDRVLACPMVVEEGKIVKGKVAAAAQKKTTVKRAPKKKPIDKKKIEREAKRIAEEAKRTAEEAKWIKVEPEKRKAYYRPEKQSVVLKEKTTGIKFVGHKSVGEKRKVLNERIREMKYVVANTESDIRGWQKGQAGKWKIDNAHIKIDRYEDAIRTLKHQRDRLRN